MGKDTNIEIAEIFERIADTLEFLQENPFRIRAYRNAARNIRESTKNIKEIAQAGKLEEIPGIGKDLAAGIREYIETGKMKRYEELKGKVPKELIELLGVQGLGPKTLVNLYKELGIKNLKTLEKALKTDEILKIYGMGEKKVEDIRRGIELFKQSKEKMPLGVALPLAEELIHEIRKIPDTKSTLCAGSLRRMKETVRDLDILTIAKDGSRVIEAFTRLPQVEEILAAGDTKGSVIVRGGIQVDLRVVEPDSYGAAIQYFTGSKEHNIKLRNMAIEKGLKINEYGVFKRDKKIAGKTEEEVYEALGLPCMPPEIREDRGEIEAALEGVLPELVEPGDIKGDLHTHSKWSDGSGTIEELALYAKNFGYEYIAVTDHSVSSYIANGLSVERLYEKKKEVERVNKKIGGIRVLMGAEVDIKGDGSLDYPDRVLKNLDVVIAAVHSGFKSDRDKMTRRIISALQNPYVHAIVHPTGRLIGEREPYDVDVDEVIKVAAHEGKALEINSYYLRLDLNDINVRKAIEKGVKIVISTDTHIPDQLEFIRYGVATARRGWVEKKDVVNTVGLEELLGWLKGIRG